MESGGNDRNVLPETVLRVAEAVRAACVQAALDGYERARMDGLCDEGALEVALDAMRSLDVTRIVRQLPPGRRAVV